MLLHNVGEHGEERDRHVRTAALIRESNLPGFTPDELNVIGVLAAAHTIHHQRELEAWLATVPSAHRPMVEKLAPLARLADGMDATHEQTVRWVEAIVAEEGKLLIRMQSRTKAKAEVHATRERCAPDRAGLRSRGRGDRRAAGAAARDGEPRRRWRWPGQAARSRETECRVETRTTV